MREINFRTLNPNEIEVRPQSVKNGKANMLLYIDSRAVVKLLNESVGNMNWQSEFYTVNGQTMCKIGIWDDERQMWIWKSDTGSESNIEAEKGLISDCYKRVLSRWGITELYSSPKIVWDDDGYGNSGYKVSEIDYNEYREITHLVIVNRFGKEAFRWDMGTVVPQQPKKSLIIENNHTDELEWTPDDNRQPVAMVQMTKQLTPAEELTQWYQSITNADPQTQRFYKYYLNKINTGQWKGAMDINRLYNNWMSRAA